jgi:hypothetical protein
MMTEKEEAQEAILNRDTNKYIGKDFLYWLAKLDKDYELSFLRAKVQNDYEARMLDALDKNAVEKDMLKVVKEINKKYTKLFL